MRRPARFGAWRRTIAGVGVPERPVTTIAPRAIFWLTKEPPGPLLSLCREQELNDGVRRLHCTWVALRHRKESADLCIGLAVTGEPARGRQRWRYARTSW